ncbi:MAG: hypothetical protein JW892_04875 [Anaerolineae bacterium]|nr:hypothetical protein [Anaerolineae bacterium]
MEQKQDRYRPNAFSFMDFSRRGFAAPRKIHILMRLIEAPEISIPEMKRTPYAATAGQAFPSCYTSRNE